MKMKKQIFISILVIVCMVLTLLNNMGTTAEAGARVTLTPSLWLESVNGSTGNWTLTNGDALDWVNLPAAAGSKTLILNAGNSATIMGHINKNFLNVAIEISVGAKLSIENLKIDNSGWNLCKSPIAAIDSNTGNTLTLSGDNACKGASNKAGVRIRYSKSLIINAGSISDKLTATGVNNGTGIGSDGSVGL